MIFFIFICPCICEMALLNHWNHAALVLAVHNVHFLAAYVRQLDYEEEQQRNLGIGAIRRTKRKYKTPPNRMLYVRPMNTPEERFLHGHWHNLLVTLRRDDPAQFINYMRMSPALFDEILGRILPAIEKSETNARSPLPPGLKLAVTLRHLATGNSYPSLAFDFRISRHTVSRFIPEVCDAICDAYKDEVHTCPTREEDWLEIAEEFERRWQLPHCLGAIDGKHIALRKPNSSGSLYYNYKNFFSIVLLAVVDADYKFLWADVGGVGHQSDAQIYNGSNFKDCLDQGLLNFPAPSPLPNDNEDMPYFLVGDDAFALRTNLMKPYSQRGLSKQHRIYNYRISRARRVVENAFGILAMRFRFLLCDAQQMPANVQKLVSTAIILHNLLRIRNPGQAIAGVDVEEDDGSVVPGAWRQEVDMREVPQPRQGANYDTQAARRVRETLRLYFNSSGGSVEWQDRMVD